LPDKFGHGINMFTFAGGTVTVDYNRKAV